MAESITVTGKTLATMIRDAPHLPSNVEDNSDVLLQLPGLPAGVKFDPSDLELVRHLEGKLGVGDSEPHALIDEFIPTLKEVEGICYTHPENLPGIKRDGSSRHFFHKVTNAYYCGKRKRRKISNRDHALCDEYMTWHKTGKSIAILDNGVIKGWRKILVLYSKKIGSGLDKANWTIHQYHLGINEDEEDGQLVVSKVFWQVPSNKTVKLRTEPHSFPVKIDPTTPNTCPPPPPRPCKTEQNQNIDAAALSDLENKMVCNGIPDAQHENLPAHPVYSDEDDIWAQLPDLTMFPL